MKILIDKTTLEQVLEALKKAHHAMQTDIAQDQIEEAITAIKEALIHPPLPVQEPVGFMNAGHVYELQQKRITYGYVYPKKEIGASVAVYTTPP